MSIAATDTREDKMKWLVRPLDLALRVCCYMAVFGFTFWWQGQLPAEQLCVVLLTALAISGVLLAWGLRRVVNVAQGRL